MGADMDRRWRVQEVLWDGKTEYQHVLIGHTSQGISLFCDSDRQSTEFSQLVYHEALMVPGFLLTENLDRVLIIGSSEGVASNLAVAAGARQVDHVDIDAECVRLCAEYLPYGYDREQLAEVEQAGKSVSGAAADSASGTDSGQESPIRLLYTDGWKFVEDAQKSGERYDLVVVDLPDEHPNESEQHNRLYGEDFVRLCQGLLNKGGVVAFQAGCPTIWRNATLVKAWNRFHSVFDTVAYYGSDEHEWAFLFGRVEQIDDPVNVMLDAFPQSPYQPLTLDEASLIGCTVPPFAVRNRSGVPSSWNPESLA